MKVEETPWLFDRFNFTSSQISDFLKILSLDIVGKCFAEHPTHDIIYRWIEVKALVLAFRGPAKARL